MKLLVIIICGALAVFALGAPPGQAATLPPLPLRLSSPPWQPLYQRRDWGLQNRLEQALKRQPSWRFLLATGKMSVALVDLTNPRAPRFAQINGRIMMYGASLPKLAILLAAYQGFQNGALRETPQIHSDLIEMIRRSDNEAAGRLTARLGLGKIEALIQSSRYRFYDAASGGGLWLGSGYVAGGEHRHEPLKDLTHAATAYQVCRFYYLLAYGRLVNPERSRQMLKILAFPDLHDKFLKALEPKVPPWRMYRKSGEYGLYHSDSILVWGTSWRRYILVSLVEDRQGEKVLEDLAPVVEKVLKSSPAPRRR
jgi:beta-lactamase class A